MVERAIMSAEKATKKRRRGSAGAVPQTATVENEMLPYLSSVPAETALQGIIDDKSRWKQTADGGYFYGDLARTFVAMGDPRSQPTADQQAATFNKILELDDSAAQTFLYVMARDLARAADAPKSRLHVNELLEFKGYKRHAKGDFFPQTKRDEQRRLVQLSDIWVAVNDEIQVQAGTRLKAKKIKLISRLVELEIEAEPNDAPSNAPVPMAFLSASTVPYAFRVSLGGWAKPYRAVSTFMQAVLATIGQYDATRETQRYAMRLMLAIMFMHVPRDGDGDQPSWRVGELLDKARIELPKHHADRFRQYVEDALDRLQRDGLIIHWQYEGANESALPGKRWLQKWLEWDLSIAVPGAHMLAASAAADRPLLHFSDSDSSPEVAFPL
jgi:hypothetical protein